MAQEAFGGSPLGQIGGERSAFTPDTAYWRGINVTRRTGSPRTRPGIKEIKLQFQNDRLRKIYETGKFQGAYHYRQPDIGYSAVQIDGHIFLIDPQSGCVFSLSDTVGNNSQIIDKVYFQQARRFLIIQDGINPAIIVDGTSSKRSDARQECVPIGTHMSYGQNRLFLATNTPDQNDFIAGDITLPENPDQILKFTETNILGLGGTLELPSSFGKITGMGFIPQLDASTGLGPLVVFAEGGAFAYQVLLPRTEWEKGKFGSAIEIGEGMIGHNSLVNIKNDMYYRTRRSISSIRVGRADFTKFGNVSISDEVRGFLSHDTEWLLGNSSATYYNGWMFMTNKPERFIVDGPRYDVVHQGVLAMDFTGSDKAIGQREPVWEGLWTHVPITQLLTVTYRGQDRMLIFSKDSKGQNRLFEQTKDECHDQTLSERKIPIKSRLYLKSYNWKNSFKRKNIGDATVWLSNVTGNFSITGYYRADEYQVWEQWGKEHNGNAVNDQCHEKGVAPSQPQNRSRLTLGGGAQVDAKVGDRGIISSGEEFQPRFDWEGCLSLDKALFEAEDDGSTSDSMSCGEEDPVVLANCPVDDYELITEST